MDKLKRRAVLGVRTVMALTLLTLVSACGTLGPKSWEKDLMAKKEMQLDANAPQMGAEDHIYFSKEAASGGRTTAGGGCGCN